MRLFVQLENGQPKAWPLIGENVKYLAPANTCFPSRPDVYETADLSEFGFETLADTSQPAFDPEAEKVVELVPIKVGAAWKRQWQVVPLTAKELADKEENIRVANVDIAIITDATVANLKALSNADFDAWWAANVTNLAQANNVLKRLARIVIRRVL